MTAMTSNCAAGDTEVLPKTNKGENWGRSIHDPHSHGRVVRRGVSSLLGAAAVDAIRPSPQNLAQPSSGMAIS
jgi:hypothetical protein